VEGQGRIVFRYNENKKTASGQRLSGMKEVYWKPRSSVDCSDWEVKLSHYRPEQAHRASEV